MQVITKFKNRENKFEKFILFDDFSVSYFSKIFNDHNWINNNLFEDTIEWICVFICFLGCDAVIWVWEILCGASVIDFSSWGYKFFLIQHLIRWVFSLAREFNKHFECYLKMYLMLKHDKLQN